MIGKHIRMERLMNRMTGKTVIVPMDHGFTMGPIEGLVKPREAVFQAGEGGANAVVLHKGNIDLTHRRCGNDMGLIIHLSASTLLSPDANYKVLVCSVEEAIKLGADGVSLHVNLGADREADMLRDFGIVSKKCQEWGMPLLVMMYTRGDKVLAENDEQYVKIAARVASEMGADMVKVSFTGSVESFARVVEGSSIPVLIAGGEKAKNTKDVLTNVKMAIEAGGKGVSMGRNVFQHENPSLLLQAVSKIVHEGTSVNEALAMLGEN